MHNSETKNTGYWITELLKIRSDLDQKVYMLHMLSSMVLLMAHVYTTYMVVKIILIIQH